MHDTQQISRGKFDRFRCTTAEFTTSALDGYGLRCQLPTRPTPYASYPVFVHRLAPLLHASFRPRLAATPLRFANPSPPSGWIEDFHLQAVDHARHTKEAPRPAGSGASKELGYRLQVSAPRTPHQHHLHTRQQN